MTFFKKYPMGDSCLCWAVGNTIDPSVSSKILSAYRFLKNTISTEPGFRDLVPSYTALALHYDPLVSDIDDMTERIEQVIQRIWASEQSEEMGKSAKVIQLKVCYTGEDLQRVASHNGLSVSEVIARHTAPIYTVAMIGFIPHFPYLIGLDKRLETPRLSSPRTKVPAGSVAIGGSQTGIYPSESPGGWNIIGTTDPEPLKQLEPGDRIKFCEESDL